MQRAGPNVARRALLGVPKWNELVRWQTVLARASALHVPTRCERRCLFRSWWYRLLSLQRRLSARQVIYDRELRAVLTRPIPARAALDQRSVLQLPAGPLR